MMLAAAIYFMALQSIGILNQRCSDAIARFTATGDAHSALTLAFEAYTEAIRTMPIQELLQLRDNPLKIPTPKILTSISGGISILKEIIPFIIALNPQAEFISTLRVIIQKEIDAKRSSSSQSKIRLDQSSDLKLDYKIAGIIGQITSLSTSSDGEILYSVGQEQSLKYWNALTGAPTPSAWGYQVEIFAPHPPAVIASQGDRLYLADAEGYVGIYNAKNGDEIKWSSNDVTYLKRFLDLRIKAMAVSQDNSILYLGAQDGPILFVDAHSGEILLEIDDKSPDSHFGDITSLNLSPDGSILYSASRDQTIKMWNAKTGEPLQRSNWFQFWKKSPIIESCLAVENCRIIYAHQDSRLLSSISYKNISGSVAGTLTIWNTLSRKQILEHNFETEEGRIKIDHSIISSDEKLIFYLNHFGHLYFRKLYSPEEPSQLLSKSVHFTLAKSPDGQYLYLGSVDSIERWNINDHLAEFWKGIE